MNRLRVTVAEFDANKDAHIWIDRCLSFFVEDARFIHNDRDHRGSISPPVAVLLGSIHPESRVHNGRFSRPVFRLDTPGQVTGFRLQTANASGLAIETGFQTDALNTKGMFKAHDGFGPPAGWPAKNIVIDKV